MKLFPPTLLLFFSFSPLVQMIGLLVPLYTTPATNWNTLISVKSSYPNLPIIAIINPSSGPGSAVLATYVTGIASLKAAGIIVLGYVDTIYGARAQSIINQDIDSYKSFYPTINGIYFDKMQYSTTGYESTYIAVRNYAVTKGFTLNFANAFLRPPVSYMVTMDAVVISESVGVVNLKSFGTYSPYISKSAMIVTAQNAIPEAWLIQAKDVISWVYVTNDVFPTPYDTLPSYLTTLAALLDTMNTKSPTVVTPKTSISDKTRSKNIAIGTIISIISGLFLIGLVLLVVFTFRKRLNMHGTKIVPTLHNLGDTTTQPWDKSLKSMDDSPGDRFRHPRVLTDAVPVPILSIPKKMI